MDMITIAIISAMILLLFVAIGGLIFFRRRSAKKQKKIGSVPGKQPAAEKSSVAAGPKKNAPAAVENKAKNSTPKSEPDPAGAPTPSHANSAAPGFSMNDPVSHEGKIRILIVDDNQETIEHVTRLLYFEDDLTVVGQAANGYQGIEMAKAKQPHIVLMDINMPDMDGITATSLLTDQVPFSQVIMISVQSDPEYMKQAMVAGARDFQPKPFTADDLINCIRRVYKIGQPVFEQYESNVSQKPKQGAQKGQQRLASTPKNGKIVALFSPKGGVGTSTIASNLAVALQKKACQTVVVDADLQFGDILVHFNIRDTRNMINLVQGGELALDLIPEILVPHSSGVHLLLGPQKPVMAEMVTSAILGSIIMDLKTRFDMVIVDLSHLLTDHILAVLERADHVLIATAPELSSVKSTRQFLELCHQLDLSLKKMSLVINFADRPGSIPPQQIEKALKLAQIYQIPFDGDVQAAINEGIVLTERSAKKEISQAIVKLAEQLHQKLSEANEEELEAQVA